MSKMKILVLDIETSPNLVYTWGLFNQFIGIDFIVEPTRVLCWAAKWVGKKTIYFKNNQDPAFLDKIWDLMNEADAIVHYNGRKFDIPHLNREFLEAGMVPPSNFFEIDLLTTVRSRFKFTSNKLQYVAERLLNAGKMGSGGMKTWIGVMANAPWAWTLMRRYNIQDVIVTEDLYDLIKGWIKNHPNHGLYVEDQENPICRNCGSDNVKNNGPEYDPTGVFAYQRLKCMEPDCGANLRGREVMKGKKAVSLQVVK